MFFLRFDLIFTKRVPLLINLSHHRGDKNVSADKAKKMLMESLGDN